jgi:hypothetical protein
VNGRRAAAAAVAAVLGPVALTGCGQPTSFEGEVVACAEGEDGSPANGVVLMAQAVPTASWVPCLDTVPLGWHFTEFEVRNDSAHFWLDSDRFGDHAIAMRFTASCDTSGATEIPSDRAGMRRLERVTSVHPQYVGRRFYVFDGGCITLLFSLSGKDRAEPLAVATQGIGAVARNDLQKLVHEGSDGRLALDPPSDAEP